jgi:hypothetical protein
MRTTEELLGIYKSVHSTKRLYNQMSLLTDWRSYSFSRGFM